MAAIEECLYSEYVNVCLFLEDVYFFIINACTKTFIYKNLLNTSLLGRSNGYDGVWRNPANLTDYLLRYQRNSVNGVS